MTSATSRSRTRCACGAARTRTSSRARQSKSRQQKSWPARETRGAPRTTAARLLVRGGLPDVLVDERDDPVDGLLGLGRVLVDEALADALEQLELHLATRFAIRGDEAIEVRARMRLVLRALHVEHRRR